MAPERPVDPRHRLVEQHEPRLGHQRAREFEQLALPARQRPGVFARLGVEGEGAQEALGALARRGLRASHGRSAEGEAMQALAGLALRAEHHVVAHAHRREDARELESAHDAAPRDAVAGEAVDAAALETHCADDRAGRSR